MSFKHPTTADYIASPVEGDRRQASAAHREYVHVCAMDYIRLFKGDVEEAAKRAEEYAASAPSQATRDIAAMLRRRADTLAGGRHA
jgi:hypothetical protein